MKENIILLDILDFYQSIFKKQHRTTKHIKQTYKMSYQALQVFDLENQHGTRLGITILKG